MTVVTTFHGTDREYEDLMKAIAGNCACDHYENGLVSKACGAHLVLTDQRVLDRLVFERWDVARLLEKEMSD